ncbi:hypothetical protein ACFQDQ_17465 [Haladaptatus sp. GCM10026878]|uniref:hypothetical protein n=4 Tax=Haladaptatus TaxID=367188 RepID=UPI00361508CF
MLLPSEVRSTHGVATDMANVSTSNASIDIVNRHRTPDGDTGPVEFATRELNSALTDQGCSINSLRHWTEADEFCLAIGTTDDEVIHHLLTTDGVEVRKDPEGVITWWCTAGALRVLVIAGTDERGLMYSLLEVANRVTDSGLEALEAVENQIEFPENEVRGIDKFVTGPVHDEWFFSEEFWHYYLGQLASCRFNRFALITGYDTSFMSPPYPFLVDIPEYPEVTLTDDVGYSREDFQSMVRTIGGLCAQYGLEFIFGIWSQMAWESNPEMTLADRLTTKYTTDTYDPMVEQLPTEAESFTDYCAQGLHKMLLECPEIDGIQLRVNYESGFGDMDTAEEFWRELIRATGEAADESGRDISLDLRAKGLTDEMIQWALETGLDVTVATKYWCESTGLPHHNTQMRSGELARLDNFNYSRRYSYGDMLRRPQSFRLLYRLWVMGTNRIFLWGDPDYARRFAHSTQFGGATGFEVTAPLTHKGGHSSLQTEAWPLFEDESLEHYEWEDERYWAWYLMFGRLGYSTETDSAVWERAFTQRFGEAADAIQKGYRSASKILPLLTAAHLTRHPGTVNWAEMDTGGALFAEHNFNRAFEDVTYATTEPSDPGLFYGISEYVHDTLNDTLRGKYTPPQVRNWYRRLATETRDAVEAAEKTGHASGEYQATKLDLLMLADLAEYHAHKTDAAVALTLFDETGDAAQLHAAYCAAERARESWGTLAARGEGTYHDDLVFVRGAATADSGQWGDRLVEMDADLRKLEELADDEGVDLDTAPADLPTAGRATFALPSFDVSIPDRAQIGEPIDIAIEIGELNTHNDLVLHYRHTDQTEGPFREIVMERIDGGYRATIPSDYVTPEWDILAYFATVDEGGNGLLIPGLYHADEPMPYYVVKVDSAG